MIWGRLKREIKKSLRIKKKLIKENGARNKLENLILLQLIYEDYLCILRYVVRLPNLPTRNIFGTDLWHHIRKAQGNLKHYIYKAQLNSDQNNVFL